MDIINTTKEELHDLFLSIYNPYTASNLPEKIRISILEAISNKQVFVNGSLLSVNQLPTMDDMDGVKRLPLKDFTINHKGSEYNLKVSRIGECFLDGIPLRLRVNATGCLAELPCGGKVSTTALVFCAFCNVESKRPRLKLGQYLPLVDNVKNASVSKEKKHKEFEIKHNEVQEVIAHQLLAWNKSTVDDLEGFLFEKMGKPDGWPTLSDESKRSIESKAASLHSKIVLFSLDNEKAKALGFGVRRRLDGKWTYVSKHGLMIQTVFSDGLSKANIVKLRHSKSSDCSYYTIKPGRNAVNVLYTQMGFGTGIAPLITKNKRLVLAANFDIE
jgi:hypothetical protein